MMEKTENAPLETAIDPLAKYRHRIMASVKNKDTKVEILVRKYLYSLGYRYRLNDKRYPGHPDIVIPRLKVAIFVNGCFWHMHDCGKFKMPRTRLDYWEPKLMRNRERDLESLRKLQELGWNVLTVWECELSKDKREKTLESLRNYLETFDRKEEGNVG